MVGLDAHRGEDASMPPGDLAHGAAVGRGGADGENLHQACGPRPIEDARKVGLQAVVVKVRVGVDEGMDARDRRGHASVPAGFSGPFAQVQNPTSSRR